MNIHFTARQTQLTPDLKDYCSRRLSSLKKLLDFAADIDVILSSEKNRQKAEIHVRAKGTGLVVVEESHDMLHSLNLAFDGLEKKMKKEREKYREKKRRGSRERKAFALPVQETVEVEKKVIRSDFFSAKPMTLEEALIQFDLKKKEVLVFRIMGEEKWAVLFRRKDGHYGLVQPE
jgi:putative sigma-54 modulation protein